MEGEDIIDLVRRLSPEEQQAVRAFIEFLRAERRLSPFLAAVDEFIDLHPELLRRLAQ